MPEQATPSSALDMRITKFIAFLLYQPTSIVQNQAPSNPQGRGLQIQISHARIASNSAETGH
jgi:hypothetical protein